MNFPLLSDDKILRQLLFVNSRQSENSFGLFTGEILKSEGLNGFAIHDLAIAPLPDFRSDDVAILTRCFLPRAQMQELKSAVEGGLRLVCFQPSWAFVEMFGWSPVKKIFQPGWITVQDGLPGGGETLQTQVPIALYEAQSGTDYSALALAAPDFEQTSKYPLITRQKAGSGEVAFFFYDLPKSIARLRFGDPERASLLNNGHWDWTHACDLFDGFVDERVIHLPQAELHAQLLVHILTDICPYPLARLWYFEKPQQRAAANMSSDDDWSSPEDFADLSDSLQKHGGRGTFYLMSDTHLPEEQMRTMEEEGHSFGIHINAVEFPEKDDDWNIIFPHCLESQTSAFRARYGGASSLSLQCHWAPWLGYMSWVPEFMKNGYRLLYSYMNHSKDLNRYMCGAGRPIKFADESGTLYDCWQQPMQTYDDLSIKERIAGNPDAVLEEFAAFLRPCLDRFHSAIGIGSHPISFSSYSRPFLERVFSLLRSENVRIYSGDDWCRFSDRRHAVKIAYAQKEDGRLKVTLSNVDGNFALMLPQSSGNIFINGVATESIFFHRLERDYLFVELQNDGQTYIEIVVQGNRT